MSNSIPLSPPNPFAALSNTVPSPLPWYSLRCVLNGISFFLCRFLMLPRGGRTDDIQMYTIVRYICYCYCCCCCCRRHLTALAKMKGVIFVVIFRSRHPSTHLANVNGPLSEYGSLELATFIHFFLGVLFLKIHYFGT